MATQASLDQEINSLIATDVPGGIPAQSLRQVLSDMNAAIFQSAPPTSAPVANSLLNASSSSASAWTTTPTLGSNGISGGAITLSGAVSGSASIAPNSTAGALNFSQGAFGTMLAMNGPNVAIANYVSTTAAISGSAVSVAAAGSDSNVSLNLQAQGSGAISLLTASSLSALSAINGIQVGTPTGGDKGLGTLNSAGTIYVNANAIEVAQRVAGTVGVTGTTSFNLTIPSGAAILGVTAYTTTAFTATGSVTLTGGTAVG